MNNQPRSRMMQRSKLVRVILYLVLLMLCWLIGVYYIWQDYELRKPFAITAAIIFIPLFILGLVVGRK